MLFRMDWLFSKRYRHYSDQLSFNDYHGNDSVMQPLGLGNFYKACRKIENGEKTDSGDIFNFDDVIPYLIFAGIMIFGVLALLIPVEVVILVSAVLTEKIRDKLLFLF